MDNRIVLRDKDPIVLNIPKWGSSLHNSLPCTSMGVTPPHPHPEALLTVVCRDLKSMKQGVNRIEN